MKYYKNTELAKLYHVSEKSVRNWIESSSQGKLGLLLYEEKGRTYVANTPQNIVLIEKLVLKGKKYKNTRGLKTIHPLPKFYETYSTKQIFDIISNITIHHEIPLQYSYVDGGADYWDQYAQRLANEEASNILKGSVEFLDTKFADIDRFLGDHKKVNVVDLGPGNGLPVKGLLEHLIAQGRLNRYIAIDISSEILEITRSHVQEWFGDKINFEGHVRDFSSERFDDLFADDYAGDDIDVPVNLVLLLSGTLCNFRSPDQALLAINNSLGLNDVMLYTTKLDTPNTRRYFDLGLESKPRPQDFLFHFVLDMLNIDESLYELDQVYDEQKHARSISMRPTVDIVIEFDFPSGTRTVQLNKNQPFLLWRYWHFSALEVINQFDRDGFTLLQATKSREQDYLMLLSRIKTQE